QRSFNVINTEAPSIGNYKTSDLIGAALDRYNWVASLWNHGIGDLSKSDPDYRPWDAIKDTPYEEYADQYVNVDNDEEKQAIDRAIDLKQKQDEVFQQAGPGLTFFTSIAASALDPL